MKMTFQKLQSSVRISSRVPSFRTQQGNLYFQGNCNMEFPYKLNLPPPLAP